MQCKEPATGLIYTFVDKVTGEGNTLVNQILILEWIVNLGVWHRTGVEPDINQICLTLHRLATLTDEYDMVYIRTMQIDLVIVLLAHIAEHKAIILQRITLHHTSLHSLLDLVIEFLHTTDADFLTILIAPYRQWRSPETGTGEVPVVQVLQPVAEASCTC